MFELRKPGIDATTGEKADRVAGTVTSIIMAGEGPAYDLLTALVRESPVPDRMITALMREAVDDTYRKGYSREKIKNKFVLPRLLRLTREQLTIIEELATPIMKEVDAPVE